MLPWSVLRELRLIATQLKRDEVEQLVAHLQRLLRRKSVKESDEDDLIGKPETIVVAATFGNLCPVGVGQGPLADHLSTGENE